MSTPPCDIIMLGDFNFPLIDWQSTVISSTHANSLLDLTNFFVLRPTSATSNKRCKRYILDLVFSNPLIMDNIDSIETSITDHNLIKVVTCIPKSPLKKKLLEPSNFSI